MKKKTSIERLSSKVQSRKKKKRKCCFLCQTFEMLPFSQSLEMTLRDPFKSFNNATEVTN